MAEASTAQIGKVLVIGGGSIGRRHLGNLRASGRVRELLVFDSDQARAVQTASLHDARACPSLEAALAERPDAALVCSPTHLHVPHALAAVRAGCHLFIEKPLGSSMEGVQALCAEVAARGVFAMVGCNLRFDEVYRAVREALDQRGLVDEQHAGRIHAAHFHFGYDLRKWRGTDYRQGYGPYRAQGGGIVLDAIHEIDLALWMFGEPRRVLSVPRHTGQLAGDSEDAVDLIIEFRSGVVASLHLNYLDNYYRRSVSVAGTMAVMDGDFAGRTSTISWHDDGEQRVVEEASPDLNLMYVRELEHFLDAIEGEAKPISPLSDGVRALEVALAARDRGPVFEFSRPGPMLERVSVVIQARLGSSRLPGKVLMQAAGRSMLAHQVERISRAKRVDRVILATSEAPADHALVEEAERLGIPWFVGSEHDVLARYLGAVRRFDLPAVVRSTADCPLIDPDFIDATIARFLETEADYCSNALPVRSAPDGFDVEVMRTDALERADREATETPDREHVTRFLYTHPERFEIVAAAPWDPVLAARRWTLDTRADYDLLRGVFEALYPHKPDFRLDDIVAAIERDPRLRQLDRAVSPPAPIGAPAALPTGGAA